MENFEDFPSDEEITFSDDDEVVAGLLGDDCAGGEKNSALDGKEMDRQSASEAQIHWQEMANKNDAEFQKLMDGSNEDALTLEEIGDFNMFDQNILDGMDQNEGSIDLSMFDAIEINEISNECADTTMKGITAEQEHILNEEITTSDAAVVQQDVLVLPIAHTTGAGMNKDITSDDERNEDADTAPDADKSNLETIAHACEIVKGVEQNVVDHLNNDAAEEESNLDFGDFEDASDHEIEYSMDEEMVENVQSQMNKDEKVQFEAEPENIRNMLASMDEVKLEAKVNELEKLIEFQDMEESSDEEENILETIPVEWREYILKLKTLFDSMNNGKNIRAIMVHEYVETLPCFSIIISSNDVDQAIHGIDERQNDKELSLDRFILALHTLANILFNRDPFVHLCPTAQSRVNLLLCLLDPNESLFGMNLAQDFCSIENLATIIQQNRSKRRWNFAITASTLTASKNMADVVKQCTVHTRKKEALSGKSTSAATPAMVNAFIARMKDDIDTRKSIQRQKLKEKAEKEQVVIEKPRFLNKVSQQLVANNEGRGSGGPVWNRLHATKKQVVVDSHDSISQLKQLDPETGQKLFQPAINEKSKRLAEQSSKSCANILGNPHQASIALHNDAKEKQLRLEQAKNLELEQINAKANTSKVDNKSKRFVRDRLQRDIKKIFSMLDTSKKGYLGVTHTLLILQHFGLFPDVLLMNLAEGGVERKLVMDLWKLIQSKKTKNTAELESIVALILIVIAKDPKSSKISKSTLSYLNAQDSKDSLLLDVVHALRLNYYTRSPQSQFMGFRLNRDMKGGIIGEKEVIAKGRRMSTRKASVSYSLDGKPIENESQVQGTATSAQRLEQLRDKILQEEAQECTFKPRITNFKKEYVSPESYAARFHAVPAHERLYENAKERKANPPVQITSKELKELEELKHCTFNPTAPGTETPDERLETVKRNIENRPSPKGFDERVAVMKVANAKRRQKLARQARPFSPAVKVDVHRTADGRVVAEPFSLQSCARGNIRVLRKHGWEKSRKMLEQRPDKATLLFRSASNLTEKSLLEEAGCPSLEVDIHLTPTWTETVSIWSTDTPQVVTQQFIDKHNIDPQKGPQILALLQQEMAHVVQPLDTQLCPKLPKNMHKTAWTRYNDIS